MEQSYEDMLNAAYEGLDEPTDSGERFVVPKTRVYLEGKTTVLENFSEIAGKLNRDEAHFLKYISGELGTAAKINGTRAVFNGKFEPQQFVDIVEEYVADFVICSECGRPDTKLIKEDRVLMLLCEACGSKRPIKKRKGNGTKVTLATASIEEGKELEVSIDSISKKGDGIAHVGKYILYVTGVKIGAKVKVRITKISGSVAFTQKIL